MSAFVVGKAHIDAMLTAALTHKRREGPMHWYYGNPTQSGQLDFTTADAAGQMLIDACVRSVRYRYNDAAPEDLPGPTSMDWLPPYVWRRTSRQPTVVEALKIIGCYEYQSCECDDWRESAAAAFCEALRHRLVGCLPGYDDAPWEWTEPDPQAEDAAQKARRDDILRGLRQ